MNNKQRITGNYRCVDDIFNFILRINLREILNENIVEAAETVEIESKTIRWQEKKFGKWEREYYKDVRNCLTDLEKKYYEDLQTNRDENKLYSYVSEDKFSTCEQRVCNSRYISDLCNEMTNLRLATESFSENSNHAEGAIYSSVNPFIENNYEIMYIMADFGEYVEDTWIRYEHILCTIKYIPQKKLLSVFPDFTIFEPYRLIVNGDITKTYEYTIENASEVINEEIFDKENEILNKIAIHERKLRQLSIGSDFAIPPSNKLHYFALLEITRAHGFEYNDVYVQYFVDLPENWSCFDQNCLRGTTQTCRSGRTDGHLYFGAAFEIALSFDLSDMPKAGYFETPYVYFEVVSKDTFDRYRTEGTCFLKLPSRPRTYKKWMRCVRILPTDVSTNLRRLFIGDYPNYDDVTWFAVPKQHQDSVLNKHGVATVATGEIEVELSVVEQSQAFVAEGHEDGNVARRERFIAEKLGSSALTKSVEQVLDAFKKARRRMLEAREKAL